MVHIFRLLTSGRRTLVALAAFVAMAAPAHAGFLTMAWTPNAEANLAGYVLCYGLTPGSCSTVVDVGNTTSWTSTTLTDGQPYYFAVLAYNTAGTESGLSAEVSAVPHVTARVNTPAAGATLAGATTTFQWSAGTGVTRYRFSVGTTVGDTSLFDQTGTATTAALSNLPASGPVFARLWSLVGATWHFTDTAYTSARAVSAQLTYPAANAVNANLTQAITWTAVATAQAYYLYIGSTVGAMDLVNTGELQPTSYLAKGLPSGPTLFARLWTKAGGVWRYTDSRFTAAASAPVTAVVTAPVNGALSADRTRPIQWTTVAGAQAYYLYVGSTLGAKNLVDSAELQATSYLAASLPVGQTVYARLWTKVGGVWRSTDSSFRIK